MSDPLLKFELRNMAAEIERYGEVAAYDVASLLRRALAQISELEREVQQHQLTLPLDS